MLMMAPALGARAGGTLPGTAAALALAPSPSLSSGTAAPSTAPGSSLTSQQVMTPRTIIPPQDLTGYVWPLVNARITLPFGPTSWGEMFVNGQRFHDGVDMSNGCGNQVLAAHDGVVLADSRNYDDFIGWIGDLTPYYNWLTAHKYWNSVPIVIVIDDGDGYRSIYAHESRVTVQVGQRVKAGDVIGIEGMTGLATGCHVHFGLFNPLETATFALDPAVVNRDLRPASEIARVNPLLVLPFRCDVEEQVALRPAEAASCPPPTQRPATPTKKPTESAVTTPGATP
jgi:murein DD-endopeptidase MepM/ murein hydrolase activator NlpD